MTHRLQSLRRFRFNRPQRIAAVLLGLFLVQGLWVISRQTLSDRDYQYARCGRETWEKPSPLAGYYTSCGNIRDGILAYRMAGLPLTLNLLVERGLDRMRKPEDRVVQEGGELSTWELRHQMTHILLLLRLPFLFAGFLLGGCIWWVTRRLYGNLGGYTALALYCFSPAVLRACLSPNSEVLAALGVYGGVYTCIGVAHAMQGPRRKPGPPATGLRRWGGKWRPRIVLLIAILGVAAAAHIVALPVTALLGLVAMLWVAEGHRSQALPVVMLASAGALVVVFACYGFSPDAASYVFRSSAGFLGLSFDPARRFFGAFANGGITIAAGAAVLLYLGTRRSRYFGNTAPLFCALFCMVLVMTGSPGSPWLWAQAFLFTFVGGVFADAYEGSRSRWALGAAAAVAALQAVLCAMSLPGLV
ncbi:MAG: hypothetical protein ACP5E2_03430 [Terracidiphilus sp.]